MTTLILETSQTSRRFQWYIIFHRNIIEDCYSTIERDTIYNHLKFYAVNENIEKQLHESFVNSYKDFLLYEYKLPIYEPLLQKLQFCESSAYIHMFMNWDTMVEPYEFVGCLQYDMKLEQRFFDCIYTIINKIKEPEKLLFYFFSDNGHDHFGSSYTDESGVDECIGWDGWDKIVMMYNIFYNTNFERSDYCYGTIPLFHCFMFHKSFFARIMPFFIQASGKIVQLLNGKTRHLPYHLERLWGLILFFNKEEGYLTEWYKLTGILHDDNIKDISWKQSTESSSIA